MHDSQPTSTLPGTHSAAAPRPHLRRRPRARFVLAVIALAAAAAGGIFYTYGRTAHGSAGPPAPAAIPVEAASAERRDVPMYLFGLGTVQAFNSVTLRTRVDGQLTGVRFTEGQEVKAGDVLATIDPKPFQAQLDQAEGKLAQDQAQLANARRDLDRFLPLAQRHDISQQQLDTQKALVAQLEAAARADQAAIEYARVQLDYTQIRAPLSGRIGMRLVDAGNVVHAADTSGLALINQLQPISVTFTVPGEDVSTLLKASAAGPIEAAAMSRDGKDVLALGAVAVIDNQIDQTTGTVQLKATFANSDYALWPGQFVNIRVKLATMSQVVTVPADAVQRGAEGTYAYVVKADGTAELRWLKTGTIDEKVAVIEQGLAAGETVVTAGHYRLQPGVHVAIRKPETKRVAQ